MIRLLKTPLDSKRAIPNDGKVVTGAAAQKGEPAPSPKPSTTANPVAAQVTWFWIALSLTTVTAFGFGWSSLNANGNWVLACIRGGSAFGIVHTVMWLLHSWLF